MDLQHLSPTLLLFYGLVGLLAGALASKILLRRGFGLLGNTTIGVVGAFLAAAGLEAIGAEPMRSHLGTGVMAFTGALVLVFVIGLARRLLGTHRGFQPAAPPRRPY